MEGEYHDKQYCLEVWGEYACFTRPEFKVERVSYDVITPSAARAIFEAIFWKPAIRWQIDKIEVLAPIHRFSIRRNEVGALAGKTPIFIEDNRQQRNAVVLKDVRYRIWATMIFIPIRDRKPEYRPTVDRISTENPGKYQAMFERRAEKGQCFNQPYLGCREFSCGFELIDPLDSMKSPIEETRDLQYMLYDMDFKDNVKSPDPIFFHAQMENGVIYIPSPDSELLLK
ncbi:MAG: type I-C CRISPR-associated protein Cas5c [Muribaculaceae bacterium]|nr:type I-C CRISPR-associated protein Cas5c [Muribaculaceae bacterium]